MSITTSAATHRTLEAIARNKAGTIRASVARIALDSDSPQVFFRDLLSHGCASGLVSELVYTADTHAFFEAHYDEIEELREEWAFQVGEPVTIRGDLKNFLAWFAFEETAYRMARDDLGLEL